MGSFARAARFLVLLQIAMFVISAVIMSGSVCHGTRPATGGTLDPDRPVCLHEPCERGVPYTGRGCGVYNRCPPGVQH
ncbi:hypothetical protein ZWY2020_002655 [Hordeum vulgare]|nr:hypothetical protein ZWY2020_002655 [Hordeum vulgare]